MTKIDLNKTKRELKALKADATSINIILNNIHLYNILIDELIQSTDTKKLYIVNQINGQIINQINNLKKLKNSKDIAIAKQEKEAKLAEIKANIQIAKQRLKDGVGKEKSILEILLEKKRKLNETP